MPGVTVTVTSPALQVPQVTVVTDVQGRYRITPLPVGIFTVTYELVGFQSIKQEGVRLEVGFVATLDQVLRPGALSETVTVTGESPTVDVTNPAHSVNLANETLETLPTNRDGLKAYLGQVPGIRTNLDVGSSSMTDTVQIRAYGQTGNPWLLLDGVMFGGAAKRCPGRPDRFQLHRLNESRDRRLERGYAKTRAVGSIRSSRAEAMSTTARSSYTAPAVISSRAI